MKTYTTMFHSKGVKKFQKFPFQNPNCRKQAEVPHSVVPNLVTKDAPLK